MKKLFFIRNHKKKLHINFFVFFFILIFIINLIVLTSTANNPNFSDNDLANNYTENSFIDYTIGKAFTLSDFTDIIGNVVEFDSQNNGYYCGYVLTYSDSNSKLVLGKLDNSGNHLWDLEWSILDQNEPFDMIYDEDTDGLYITGVTYNSSTSYKETFLACFDPTDGSEDWNITVGDAVNSFIPNSMTLTEEYIFVTGITTPFWNLNTKHDIILHCFRKSDGLLQWSRIDNSVDYNTHPSIIANEKNDEIFLLYNKRTGSSIEPIYQYRIQKLNYSGYVINEIEEPADEFIKINDIILHNESDSFILIGDFWESSTHNYKNSIILKYDFTLTQQFQLVIGESERNEEIHDIVFDSQNNLIVTGFGDSDFKVTTVGYIGKYSWDGSEIWASKFELFYKSVFNGVAIDSNDKLLLTGYGQYYSDFIFRRLFVGYTIDSDNDLLSDVFELNLGTDPLNPDTDGDGYFDGREYLAGTDPLKAASNPGLIKFWNNFGLIFTLILVIIFVIINLLVYFTTNEAKEKEQSALLKVLSKIKRKKPKQLNREENEES